jgi:hypothetical protein
MTSTKVKLALAMKRSSVVAAVLLLAACAHSATAPPKSAPTMSTQRPTPLTTKRDTPIPARTLEVPPELIPPRSARIRASANVGIYQTALSVAATQAYYEAVIHSGGGLLLFNQPVKPIPHLLLRLPVRNLVIDVRRQRYDIQLFPYAAGTRVQIIHYGNL